MEKDYTFRGIAYQELDGTFTGVCLDLNIVEENHQTIQEAVLSLNDAVDSHLQVAARLGFPTELIDRPAPKEYWDMLVKFTGRKWVTTEPNRSFLIFSTPAVSARRHAKV